MTPMTATPPILRAIPEAGPTPCRSRPAVPTGTACTAAGTGRPTAPHGLPPAHQGLRRPPYRRGQDQNRDHALPQALDRPRNLPAPAHGPARRRLRLGPMPGSEAFPARWFDRLPACPVADLGPVAWPPEPIRTERLVLREPGAQDRSAVIELLASPEVGTYLGGPRPRDELERTMPGAPERRPGLFIVDLDGAMIGMITLDRATGHIRPAAGEAELGYLFLPDAWECGYAAEACNGTRLVRRRASVTRHIRRVCRGAV